MAAVWFSSVLGVALLAWESCLCDHLKWSWLLCQRMASLVLLGFKELEAAR